jgi:hypothetical protein
VLRLRFADCPIGFPAEIVPKPFAECPPFLLLSLPHYLRVHVVLNIRGRNISDPFAIPLVIVKLEAR